MDGADYGVGRSAWSNAWEPRIHLAHSLQRGVENDAGHEAPLPMVLLRRQVDHLQPGQHTEVFQSSIGASGPDDALRGVDL